MQRVNLGGVAVDLLDFDEAVSQIKERAAKGIGVRADNAGPASGGSSGTLPLVSDSRPLAVVSANLDHIAQFGSDGRWHDTLDYRLARPDLGYRPEVEPATSRMAPSADWLTLLDGAPLVTQAGQLTGRSWPRLAGSDLIGPLLDAAEEEEISVGFLGGSPIIQRLLSRRLTRTRPNLLVSGMWSPDRSVLSDHAASLELADVIAASGTQLLVVGLGKPRQELWIAEYGPYTGANVLLAFGAVVDFLAGSVRRAPKWASEHSLEWAWRLALEPRRLARRYLVDDPPSLIQLRRHSSLLATDADAPGHSATLPTPASGGNPDGSFVPLGEPADVVVYVVTYNSADALAGLIKGLRQEAQSVRLRVVVADNDSPDGTLHALADFPDVYALPTGGNLGYAGGINAAMHLPGGGASVLVLNPDMVVEPGAIRALHRRMVRSGAGIVVPQLLESDGATYPSLRREPTIVRAFGDALFGSRFPTRPAWLAEMDYDAESYRHPHRVQWATGAALLVRADVAERLGDWDEQFFLYSEEVDYFRRAREFGEAIWYEPSSVMTHQQGGSGSSPKLNALMAVNRIRYVRKYHSRRYAAWFRSAVVLAEVLRCFKPSRRGILRTVLNEHSWDALPGPTAAERTAHLLEHFPPGAVIIPAHNEGAVISNALDRLVPVLATGKVEVIVACNGCTDNTAQIAKEYDGVRVLELGQASKTAALNAADAAASRWPRLYLDADIEISPAALRMVLDRLGRGDVLAARPAFRYDTAGASWPVKAFYRARRRIPSTAQALWGAGVYGLTEAGHQRFGEFPTITADDLLVDESFTRAEKAVVHAPPVSVRTPRDIQGLLAILQRNYRGQAELRQRGFTASLPAARSEHPVGHVARPQASLGAGGVATRRTLRELLNSVRGPASALNAAIYACFVAAARVSRKHGEKAAWERDDTSRRTIPVS
ncbi:WecB/TagA/CpsF family glycosyltransferase [Crystallibacter degradans]|uniref:WecB/TagA/CpsF family glycosyltransferase n=1 Tax=Crystallibacter degradans TaxID=2726743 RepID=UPI001472824A|nr:WecB/TagA/CpsF family glycosyltransferase [Arthrobacter sp. SF27]NMR28208.1 WecB/TagA/CpsF family glycosyltransferase [Arthrobacter sp. SF27]